MIDREGIGEKGDAKTWCHYCEYEVRDLRRHLRLPSRDAKVHVRNRAMSVEIAQQLSKSNAKLAYERITIKDYKFERELYGKKDFCYECFKHIDESNSHAKARLCNDTIPKCPKDGPPQDQCEAWQGLFAQGPAPQASVKRQASEAMPATTPASSAAPAQGWDASPEASSSDAPAMKKRRTEATGGGAPPKISAKIPAGCEYEPAPSEDVLREIVGAADRKFYPPLETPLHGSTGARKQGLWIWRSACAKWVGWAHAYWNERCVDLDADGQPEHYTARCKAPLKGRFQL